MADDDVNRGQDFDPGYNVGQWKETASPAFHQRGNRTISSGDRITDMAPTKTEPAPTDQSQPRHNPDLEQKFRKLVAEWESKVAVLSSTTARVQHPSYQEIVALGPDVVPLLLRELEQRPNHWFAALKSLTGADPVPRSDRGRIGPMTEAWIRWGREHGYL
jgi:hypothetical protein